MQPAGHDRPVVIVAILEVRRAELAAFREFERQAARVMREHHGELERTVVVDDGASDGVTEIHVVRFATEADFQAYRTSPELAAVAHLRERAVSGTNLYIGADGPVY